jgi:prepilin-type processing-associated H-X9-DG protein/prepilin-type N-terminal cleavage/methylation domain-containing protein
MSPSRQRPTHALHLTRPSRHGCNPRVPQGWGVRGMKAARRIQRGFTLTELLVVIGIIGLLIALLLPVLARSKTASQSTVCKNNLRQLGISLQMFVSENHFYPENRFQTNPVVPASSDRFWLAKLARETLGVPPATNFNQEGVWRCPAVRWSEPLMLGYTSNGDVPSSYGYNDDRFAGGGARDYANKFGLQGHYVPDFSLANPLDLIAASFTPIAESEVAVPSDMMAIGDGFEGNALLRRDPVETFITDGNILARHQGRANVMFCDGHVEAPTLKFLLEDNSDQALVRWNRDHQPHRRR